MMRGCAKSFAILLFTALLSSCALQKVATKNSVEKSVEKPAEKLTESSSASSSAAMPIPAVVEIPQPISIVAAIPQETVTGPWIEKPQSGNFYLTMHKAKNELTVRSFDDGRVLKIYRAISGTNSGDKEREGDLKTPEGIYFIDRRIPKERLFALHGSAAFELNYPNAVDHIFKRSGKGIWIHGVDRDDRMKKSFDTRGCVAISNDDVLDLAEVMTMRDVPIVIFDREIPDVTIGLEAVDGPIHKRVQAWANAWMSKDAVAYLSFYSPDFYSRNMNYEQWTKYKTRLTKQYTRINVEISDLKILRHGKYSVAIFNQNYDSNVFHVKGRKRLYLIGEGETALILAEEAIDESVKVEAEVETVNKLSNSATNADSSALAPPAREVEKPAVSSN